MLEGKPEGKSVGSAEGGDDGKGKGTVDGILVGAGVYFGFLVMYSVVTSSSVKAVPCQKRRYVMVPSKYSSIFHILRPIQCVERVTLLIGSSVAVFPSARSRNFSFLALRDKE